jgi:predicted acylesterase/phospholipase RssA
MAKIHGLPEKPEAKANPKRVLVLSGGGAKGGYEFGCIQAMRDHGIEFDAVAGTSVGALNALIWTTNQFSKGEELWKNLSFGTIYPSRLPKWLPTRAKWAISSLYVLFQFVWAGLHQIPFPGIVIVQRVLAFALVGLPMLVSLLVMERFPAAFRDVPPSAMQSNAAPFIVGGIFVALVVLAAFLLSSQKSKGLFFFQLLVFQSWLAFSWVVLAAAVPSSTKWNSWAILSVVSAIALATLGTMYRLAASAANSAVLSSEPLKSVVHDLVTGAEHRIPCFVASGVNRQVFDPDNPDWMTYDSDADGVAKSWAEWQPSLQSVWVPHYACTNNLSVDDAVAHSLASAALPVGIVSPQRIAGEQHIDGGVIDNTPLFPVLQLFPGAEVFVVLLMPFEDDVAASNHVNMLLAAFPEIDRTLRVCEFPMPATGRQNQLRYWDRNVPPTVLKYREFEPPASVTIFYPKKTLGNAITGTLNLNSTYAERIRLQGYSDASERLSTLAELRH